MEIGQGGTTSNLKKNKQNADLYWMGVKVDHTNLAVTPVFEKHSF